MATTKRRKIFKMKNSKSFSTPLYVTRPLLPDISAITEKLQEIWASQWLTNNGKQHQALEEKVRQCLDVPALSLFNNGTIALIVACRSLNLTGEVITTPFTFPATPHVLSWNNICPVFGDIDSETLNLDASKIETLITSKTTAILATHVFGVPCDVYTIQKVADKYGLKVLYDAAHAFGTEVDGVGIGNFGDISMFSFHATKLFHTVEGGALSFKDTTLKTKIDLLRNFGIKNEEEVITAGINGKMNEIQAVIGLEVLKQIESEKSKRAQLLDTYHQELADIPGISFFKQPKSIKNSYQYFAILIKEEVFGRSRDEVYNELKKYNVFSRKYFYPLCSNYSCYKDLPSSAKEKLPIAHQIVQEVLSLPFYGTLSIEDVKAVCAILKGLKQ